MRDDADVVTTVHSLDHALHRDRAVDIDIDGAVGHGGVEDELGAGAQEGALGHGDDNRVGRVDLLDDDRTCPLHGTRSVDRVALGRRVAAGDVEIGGEGRTAEDHRVADAHGDACRLPDPVRPAERRLGRLVGRQTEETGVRRGADVDREGPRAHELQRAARDLGEDRRQAGNFAGRVDEARRMRGELRHEPRREGGVERSIERPLQHRDDVRHEGAGRHHRVDREAARVRQLERQPQGRVRSEHGHPRAAAREAVRTRERRVAELEDVGTLGTGVDVADDVERRSLEESRAAVAADHHLAGVLDAQSVYARGPDDLEPAGGRDMTE